MSFLEVLDLIFSSFGSVISAIDVPLFSFAGADISLWNLLLGGLICFIIFSFFLRPRGGSAWGAASNFLNYENTKESYSRKSKG